MKQVERDQPGLLWFRVWRLADQVDQANSRRRQDSCCRLLPQSDVLMS